MAEHGNTAPSLEIAPEAPRDDSLRAVPEGAEAPASAAPGRMRRALPWLLAAVACVFAYLWQAQVDRADALEVRVGVLSEELQGTRRALDAYTARMGEVRGQVDTLLSGMIALDALVAEDPLVADAAAPSESAAPAEGSAAAQ